MSLTHRWALFALCSALFDCGPSEQRVEETGYFNGGQIVYSSASPLGSASQPMLIVGLPGALERAQGTLTVSAPNDQASTLIEEEDGRFLLEIDAESGDTLQLVYLLQDAEPMRSVVELTLDDGLDNLPAPQLQPGTGVKLLSEAPQGAQVNLSNLDSGTPPYVVLNQSSGDIALANDLSPVQLPANTGDEICVFQLSRADGASDSGLSSPTFCETF